MQIGDVVGGRFTLEALRGAGGMGQVFRARDAGGGLVALKVLHAERAARFEREVAALKTLSHPAIVRYVASGPTDDGRLYLAMEWLDGVDLGERLARGPLGSAATLALASRVASALASAHAQGIVHRDIKPENIFLPGGDVEAAKVLDFGLARLRGAAAATISGTVIGTPGYMAPEQARGLEAGPAADVFSLGSVLFECLSGRRAFPGEHPIAVLTKVLFDQPPRLADLGIAVAPGLSALVGEMLAKGIEDRPPDGRVLERRLAELPAEAPVSHTAAPAPAGITTHEQELVSLVLLSSPATDREATLDASGWEATCRSLGGIVEAMGGRIEALIGGTLVATAAGRGTIRDQAHHAARCALVLRAAAPELCVVLATGARASGQGLPMGEVIDRCAALLHVATSDAASRDAVLLDAVTARLLGPDFDVAEGPNGFSLRAERREPAAGAGASPLACFGRERELATLVALLEESTTEPAARVALLVGPAGIGKTRLLHELLAATARFGAEVWTAGADLVSTGSPFALVARAVRRKAGIGGDEPADVQRAALHALSARLVPAAAPRVGAGLSQLCGVHGESQAAAPDDARRAFEDLVAAACRARPLVLALEDLHWADLPSVRLLDSVLRREARRPLLLVATARPEVSDVFPKLWAGRALHEIRVAELGGRAAERLVRARLGARATAGVIDDILRRAAGNAFFLEELARAALDGRTDVPETVVGVVQSRIRALEAEARRVLRAASIFGQTFSAEGVLAVLGAGAEHDEVARHLERLVEADVLVAADETAASGSLFAFAHALVRDAAYSMLTAEDRALGHALAGDWMERRGELDPMLVAHHLENGGERVRAARWYERSAAQALAAGDAVASRARAERGLGCDAEGELRGRLAALSAEASMALGDMEEAARRASEALGLVPRGSPAWHMATRATMARAVSALGFVPGRR